MEESEVTKQEGETVLIPEEYYSEANEQGNVVRIEYKTYNYSGSKEEITKPAYVYQPYGYDENDTKTKYDTFYMMHGWTGTACPTGAITKVEVEKVKMGSAVIDKLRCIAWNGDKMCLICGEQCPVLAIKSDGSKIPNPVLILDKCVGCGTCERACPVTGEAAIVVRPK